MNQITIEYQGFSKAILTPDQILGVFDALWGKSNRVLPRYPKVIGGVSAFWRGEDGASRHVSNIDQLLKAYTEKLTYDIHIQGSVNGSPRCNFSYIPAKRLGYINVMAPTRETAEQFLKFVKDMCPEQEKPIVFISYATSEVPLAEFVRRILIRWTESRIDAFVAKRDIPSGDNPLKIMLEEKLKNARAVIPICSAKSKLSTWLWWEAAAVWAGGYKIHPLFTNISPKDFGAPLTLVSQGREYFIKEEFVDTLKMIGEDLGVQLVTTEFSAEEMAEFQVLTEKYSKSKKDIDFRELRMARDFLSTLSEDLKEYYDVLFTGPYPYLHMEHYYVLGNYKDFNTENKRAMWQELVKLEVFSTNPKIFNRINKIYSKVEELNLKMKTLKPERHSLNAGSVDVRNYREIMDDIKNLYIFPKGEGISYEETPVGEFLTKNVTDAEVLIGDTKIG
ncbi:MAG: hypothetical protein CV087_05730 [Candidatus Brocadia sp. WS118]|nr:MAG: hypothetical protein CV087_05730 [Candidatus Brocadia sp. WS118]